LMVFALLSMWPIENFDDGEVRTWEDISPGKITISTSPVLGVKPSADVDLDFSLRTTDWKTMTVANLRQLVMVVPPDALVGATGAHRDLVKDLLALYQPCREKEPEEVSN
jgi:gamma-glutamylcysteine synthetase